MRAHVVVQELGFGVLVVPLAQQLRQLQIEHVDPLEIHLAQRAQQRRDLADGKELR